MSKQNRERFDSYPNDSYFKTNEKAQNIFPSILQFPKAAERYDKIKIVILVFRTTVIELDKIQMQRGDYGI